MIENNNSQTDSITQSCDDVVPNKPKKKKAVKIVCIVLSCILALLLLAGGALYATFSHYYGMLHYEELFSEEEWSVVTEEEEDPEDTIDTSKLATEEEKDKFIEQVEKVESSDTTGSTDNTVDNKKLGGSLGEIERNYSCEYISRSDDTINVLLIGIDARYNISAGLSDVMMVVSICPSQKKIVLTSFLRDVYVMIPGVGGNRLNAAYSYGGPSLLVETIEKNFGLRIDRYATINFYSFVDVVDRIGNIRLYLNEAECEVINKHIYWTNNVLTPNAKDNKTRNTLEIKGAGYYDLNGTAALAYSRIRNIDSDFGRTNRQRNVISAVIDKVSGMNASTWNALLEMILPKIRTNLSQNDIIKIMFNVGTYIKYPISSVSMPPTDHFRYMQIGGRSVIGVDQEYIREYLRTTIYGK